MTPLRQRMINDMTVRGLAENTKKSYLTSGKVVDKCLLRLPLRSPLPAGVLEVPDQLLLPGVDRDHRRSA